MFAVIIPEKKCSPLSDFAIYNIILRENGKWQKTENVFCNVYQNVHFYLISVRILLHYNYITMTFCLIVHGYIDYR